VITMQEIDVRRAVLDAAREAYRCAFRALEKDDDVSPHRFGALLDAVDRTEAGVKTAEADVEAALRQWWAQGCRAEINPPPCPRCNGGPVADLAGRDGKRLVTCPCGASTYGAGDPPPRPGMSWAAYAGDLAGRLESVRRIVERLPAANFTGPVAQSILRAIDAP
jgi:hypothetical protein